MQISCLADWVPLGPAAPRHQRNRDKDARDKRKYSMPMCLSYQFTFNVQLLQEKKAKKKSALIWRTPLCVPQILALLQGRDLQCTYELARLYLLYSSYQLGFYASHALTCMAHVSPGSIMMTLFSTKN
jgi:hypothetical protein